MPQTYELNIRDYLRIIRKRKWIILFCFSIALASSFFYTRNQKPTYLASATVRIQERQHKILSGLLFLPLWDIETETKTITSFKIVAEVARRLGWITPEMPEEEQNNLVRARQAQIKSERVGQTSLIKVTVTSSKPDEPAKIANLLTAVYVEENYKVKSKEKRNLRVFVEEQLNKYEAALAESEVGLQQFKESLPLNLQDQTLDSLARVQGDPLITQFKNRLVQLEIDGINLLRTCTEEHPRVIAIRQEIANIEEQINSRIEEFTQQIKALPEMNIKFARLLRNLELNRDLYLMFSKKLEEVKIAEAEEVSDVEIVEPAGNPKPIIPNRTSNLILGGLMGIILGLMGAFIFENLDVSIGTIEEVEEFLQLPVLGVIPYIKIEEEKRQFWRSSSKPRPLTAEPYTRRQDKRNFYSAPRVPGIYKVRGKRSTEENRKLQELQMRLVTQFSPKSVIVEAFRVIQTNIQFTALEKIGNTLIFTSVGAKEGKTIAATNCAITMAQMGKRVLLVDCDFRRPAIHKIFGLPKEGGLSEVLIGDLDKEEAIKTMTDILLGDLKAREILQSRALENLNIIFTGHLVTNPAALITSNKMSELIRDWKNKFDIVIFDSPPVLPVTDVSILASKVDGTILVYQVGKVARSALRRAKLQLESVGGKVVGIILNNIRATEMELGDSYYYYRYGYGKEKEKQETA